MAQKSVLALRVYVFLGAFLLFVLEPLSGRMLLPLFGGAFHVWTTALMFFQGTLVLGYLYAHVLPAKYHRAHIALMILPMALWPLAVHSPLASPSVSALVLCLARSFGFTAMLLSTTGVIAQSAIAAERGGTHDPYGLYAISNAGSLAALCLDALVFAPRLGLRLQSTLWCIAYLAYALSGAFALSKAKGKTIENQALGSLVSSGRMGWELSAECFFLAASVSAMLSGVTNQIALDIGHAPLVWAIPLALYLLSFVVAFDPRDLTPVWVRRLSPHIAAVGLYLCLGGTLGNPFVQAFAHLCVFSVLALCAHDTLYRDRPPPAGLTRFYLTLALGGWAGGAFVALVAPRIFTSLAEHPLSIVLLLLTLGLRRRRELFAWFRSGDRSALALAGVLVLVIAMRLVMATVHSPEGPRTLDVRRSEYGLYHVFDRAGPEGTLRELVSGTTRHGRQRHMDPEPLSYYHRQGPLGEALAPRLRVSSPMHIGVVGLGVGATAAYLRPGDRATFYEIDPTVIALARSHFRYLHDARGEVHMRTGDARAEMSRSRDRYDLLLIDAFAGDAIPTHLLTREAVLMYLAHLAPGGTLLFHVSNRFFDLRPVLRALASELRVTARWTRRLSHLAPGQDPGVYGLLCPDPEGVSELSSATWRPMSEVSSIDLWTDDRADTLTLLWRSLRE